MFKAWVVVLKPSSDLHLFTTQCLIFASVLCLLFCLAITEHMYEIKYHTSGFYSLISRLLKGVCGTEIRQRISNQKRDGKMGFLFIYF